MGRAVGDIAILDVLCAIACAEPRRASWRAINEAESISYQGARTLVPVSRADQERSAISADLGIYSGKGEG
jgi:hypothetical protein